MADYIPQFRIVVGPKIHREMEVRSTFPPSSNHCAQKKQPIVPVFYRTMGYSFRLEWFWPLSCYSFPFVRLDVLLRFAIKPPYVQFTRDVVHNRV